MTERGAAGIEARVLARLGVPAEAVAAARSEHHESGRSLAEVLAERQVVDPRGWSRAVADEVGLPFCDSLADYRLDVALATRPPRDWALRHALLPLAEIDGMVETAVSDLTTHDALAVLEDLRLLLDRPVRPVLAPAPVIRAGIVRAHDDGAANPAVVETHEGAMTPLDQMARRLDVGDGTATADGAAPVVAFVDAVLAEAVAARASDVHIEPFEGAVRMRYRIDGVLYDVLEPPAHAHPAIVSRLKIMAALDIAERRLPQDGRIRVATCGRDIDVRVSIVPTIFGERIVLRLLDLAATPLSLAELGFADVTRGMIERLLGRSHGIVLATGPTGSGKTTTLYAALGHIVASAHNGKNILTVEDPVEYQLPGVGQIQINPKIALTFANGLRALLRQDPDIIMVGEIRDRETADIAVHAALTGHLVLSTLHTTDSIGAITRLLDMGIEPFLVSSAVTAVIGQRLVRRVCANCRLPGAPPASDPVGLGLPADLARPLWAAGPGCNNCRRTGYRGRTGIFELLMLDDDLRALVMRRADATALRQSARTHGMIALREHGADKVRGGITTVDELLRVTRDDVQ
jgi:general secretion pathway protein E